MSNNNNNNNMVGYGLLGLVGIVAVVGIISLILSFSATPKTNAESEIFYDGHSQNTAGLATGNSLHQQNYLSYAYGDFFGPGSSASESFDPNDYYYAVCSLELENVEHQYFDVAGKYGSYEDAKVYVDSVLLTLPEEGSLCDGGNSYCEEARQTCERMGFEFERIKTFSDAYKGMTFFHNNPTPIPHHMYEGVGLVEIYDERFIAGEDMYFARCKAELTPECAEISSFESPASGTCAPAVKMLPPLKIPSDMLVEETGKTFQLLNEQCHDHFGMVFYKLEKVYGDKSSHPLIDLSSLL